MPIENTNKLITYPGKWFIPEKKIVMPGLLIIDENNRQSIKLYSKIDFNGIPIANYKFELEYSTICGNCELGDKITLHNCKYRNLLHIGGDIFEITFEPSFSFFGGIFFNHNKTKVTQLTCAFPYFSSWFDANRLFFGPYSYTIGFNSETGKTEDTSIKDTEPSLTKEELFDEIKIDDDFSIIIERRYQTENFILNTEVKSEIKHFVHFKSSSNKSLDEFIKLAYNFMQLIQLSIGELMNINFCSVFIKKEELIDFSESEYLSRNKESVIIKMFNYNSIHKRNLIKSKNIECSNMLFYGGKNYSGKLNQIIINWYNTIDKYLPIYNIFNDNFEWFQNTDAALTQVMFNNRFLNLVQSLESYHKFSYTSIEDENKEEIKSKAKELLKEVTNNNDNKWLIDRITPLHITLKERLHDLLYDKLVIISSELFQNCKKRKSYIEKIKDVRNDLSHGKKVEMEVSEISDYYYKTLILLLSCILLNLGLSQIEIKDALFKTTKYKNMIDYIKSKK